MVTCLYVSGGMGVLVLVLEKCRALGVGDASFWGLGKYICLQALRDKIVIYLVQ